MIRFAASFLVALSLSMSILPAQAQGVVATPRLNLGMDVAKVFESYYPKTMAVLHADFPAEYAGMQNVLRELQKVRGTDEARMTAAFVALTKIRKKYADRLHNAPPDSVKRVWGLLAEFHQAVLKDQGAKFCGDFAVNGSGTLFQHGAAGHYAARLDAQSEAYFNAVVAAIENPEIYGEPDDTDWSLAGMAMIANGGSEDDIKRILANDPRDPQLCASLADFFLILAALDQPFSKRVLANFAPAASGY